MNRIVQRLHRPDQLGGGGKKKLPSLEALMLDMDIDEPSGKSLFNLDEEENAEDEIQPIEEEQQVEGNPV